MVLPAWSAKTTYSPVIWGCYPFSSPRADVIVAVDSTKGCGYGGSLATSRSSTVPQLYYQARIWIGGPCTSYDHSCGTVDDGCTTTGLDDRILVSHEVGHSLGLGHCDLNYGVMCHVKSSTTSEQAEGTSYWTPQSRDIMGLKVIY